MEAVERFRTLAQLRQKLVSEPLVDEEEIANAGLDDPEDLSAWLDALLQERDRQRQAEFDRVEEDTAILLSEATIDEMLECRLVKREVDLPDSSAILAQLRGRCECGHTREVHDSSGCWVGQEWWNKLYRRNDDLCPCSGFDGRC